MPMRARYAHTNLIARDWKSLARFYTDVFGCSLVPPERHFEGKELEEGTGVEGARLEGGHLRLPGHGGNGPTLEIFTYKTIETRDLNLPNFNGLGHIAFEVDDVQQTRESVLAAGGKVVGKVVTLQPGPGMYVTWCYVRDPEGNIIELQSWSSTRNEGV